VPEHREVHPIIKEANEVTPSLFGGGWHTDSPFLPEPPSVTTLRQLEGPPYGGDTAWANMALAFRHLSPTYRDMLRPLRVHMSAANNYATQNKLRGEAIQFGDQDKHAQGMRGSYHPLVRTHPFTGEESLYVCDTYAVGIEGMTTHEARPIIEYLVQHATQQAFTCRLRWQPGMVAMWDNRATMHLGPNDYDGFRREMYRTTTAGEKPV
jgi:taurine dioxygenase